ncbi:MAG: hypothetical protein Q4Q17_01520 [Tissierellia bacterium]|nr:hypothetical protein [Tissierellia bacterium]
MKKITIVFMTCVLIVFSGGCTKNPTVKDEVKTPVQQKATQTVDGKKEDGPRKLTTAKEMPVNISKDKVTAVHIKSKMFEEEVREVKLTGEEKEAFLDYLNELTYTLALGDENRDDWINWVILDYVDESDPSIIVHELLFIDKMGQLDGINMIFDGYDAEEFKTYVK